MAGTHHTITAQYQITRGLKDTLDKVKVLFKDERGLQARVYADYGECQLDVVSTCVGETEESLKVRVISVLARSVMGV